MTETVGQRNPILDNVIVSPVTRPGVGACNVVGTISNRS